MRSSRSLGDLKGSLLKGSERVRKHSTGEPARRNTERYKVTGCRASLNGASINNTYKVIVLLLSGC